MAFNNSAARSNTNQAPAATNDSWKAQGFLNIYLPSKEAGKRRKLGAIPLKDANVNEATLRAWLEADEGNLDVLISKLIVEYQSAEPTATSGFDLD